MDYQKTAMEILAAVGGRSNIENATHCMSRLRLKLRNPEIANDMAIEKIEGVLGIVFKGDELQVIIGTNVDKVFRQFTADGTGGADDAAAPASPKKKNPVDRVLEMLGSVLSPMVPVIMGAAFITILITVLNLIGILPKESSTYILLNHMSGVVYHFFPVLVALSLAKWLKVNPYFAVICACFLLYPSFTGLFAAEGAQVTLFGISVMNVSYAKQIFPIVLSVFAQMYIERAVNKFTPKSIRTMVGSGIVLILTIGVTILLLGPIGSMLTQGINWVVYFVVEKMGWVAIPIIAFINPFMLGTGLGSAMFPIMLSSFIAQGYEALVLPAALAGNAAQAGSGLAVAIKSTNKKLKEIATEGAIAAFMGVTEPIIFSVHYKLKRTFLAVMAASGIAACLPGIFGVKSYALATGILSLPGYLPGGTANFILACLSMAVGITIGFVVTYFVGFDDPAEE